MISFMAIMLVLVFVGVFLIALVQISADKIARAIKKRIDTEVQEQLQAERQKAEVYKQAYESLLEQVKIVPVETKEIGNWQGLR